MAFLYIFHLSLSLSDFDGDNFISAGDIENAVKLLTQNEMGSDEIESIWEKVSLKKKKYLGTFISRIIFGKISRNTVQYKKKFAGVALVFSPPSVQVLFEADIDDDRKLSPSEFEHVITKSPDFLSTFHFRI